MGGQVWGGCTEFILSRRTGRLALLRSRAFLAGAATRPTTETLAPRLRKPCTSDKPGTVALFLKTEQAMSATAPNSGPVPTISHADAWGPFAPGLCDVELVARLRCLAAVLHILTGPRGRDAVAALRSAEAAPMTLPAALVAFGKLEPTDRRRALASYAAINRPAHARTWAETVGKEIADHE